jgi:hypothetical protein
VRGFFAVALSATTDSLSYAVSADVPVWIASVLQAFLRTLGDGSVLRDWSFESRYFSSLILFSVDHGRSKIRRYIAKFPKAVRSRGYVELPPRVAADLELADQELKAFTALAQSWPRGDVVYVEPRFYDAAVGMLVFDYIDGANLYEPTLPRKLLLRQPVDRIMSIVRRTGEVLAEYHRAAGKKNELDGPRLVAKLEESAAGMQIELPKWIHDCAASRVVTLVPGIKGFELRNIRVSADRTWLFDPGRLRQEPAEADIARFLASIWIIGWGTPYFALPLGTNALEQSFLEGYRRRSDIDARLLAVFSARELLWNWREGRAAMAWKKLAPPWDALLTRLYVEGPFRRLWRNGAIRTP